jgi:hypothetical protein
MVPRVFGAGKRRGHAPEAGDPWLTQTADQEGPAPSQEANTLPDGNAGEGAFCFFLAVAVESKSLKGAALNAA